MIVSVIDAMGVDAGNCIGAETGWLALKFSPSKTAIVAAICF